MFTINLKERKSIYFEEILFATVYKERQTQTKLLHLVIKTFPMNHYTFLRVYIFILKSKPYYNRTCFLTDKKNASFEMINF